MNGIDLRVLVASVILWALNNKLEATVFLVLVLVIFVLFAPRHNRVIK